MKFFKFVLPMLAAMLFSTALKAEDAKPDAPKVDDAKPTETKPADAPKSADAPKTDGELPKAPDGNATLAESHTNESLVGDIGKAKPKDKAEKKAAKKGGGPDSFALHVAGEKIKGDKSSKKGRVVTLTATGDVLAQLKSFAEKKAHIKVTGDLTGDTMTVKEVSEAPADKKKKKDKNNNV